MVVCGSTLPWTWHTPSVGGLLLMLALGCASGLGQFLLYEGFRRAPASTIAPCEYTALVWAFCLGFLVWGDVPAPAVFAGAGLIVLASLVGVAAERRRSRLAAS
jgi:S-adenosylmethionine uptake transporter